MDQGRTTRAHLAPGLLLAVSAALWASASAAISGVTVPPDARDESAFHAGEPRVTAKLLIDSSVADDGLRVGVLFELDAGWHVYWRNPGESGLPTRIRWRAEGADFGPLQWPAPRAFAEADGMFTTYGYSDSVLLTSDVELDGRPGEPPMLHADADLLACRKECIPASFALSRPLVPLREDSTNAAATRTAFSRARASLPLDATALGLELEARISQSAVRPGDSFLAAIIIHPCARATQSERDCALTPPAPDRVVFFPHDGENLELESRGITPHPSREGAFVLTLAGHAPDDADSTIERLSGVLVLSETGGRPAPIAIDLPLVRAAAGADVQLYGDGWLEREPTPDPDLTRNALARALLLALLGGLILNLMPCVLPVLAIKVFSVAELAQRSRRELLAHGAAYSAGILGSMLALAVVVIALRAAGNAVGWGFQFQEPLFVATISTLLVVFALNLFGVFEIELQPSVGGDAGANEPSLRRSFFEGLLAVVLATPCSAPFLGTAIGFAFASAAPVIAAIFLAIGAGLAAPYALVTLVPAWSKLVPRPGAWMLKLRAVLGFALLATVVWLLWVVGRGTGVDGMITLLGFLVVVAFSLWVYGRIQASRSRLTLAFALALSALVLTGLNVVRVELARSEAPAASAASTASGVDWRPFEPTAIEAELAAERPVLVVFSADWCITCKVNERIVLSHERVQSALAELDVATFKADWTLRDDEIRKELARHGKAGVPLYLVYSPVSRSRPVVLPELLTVDLVLDVLRDAAGPDNSAGDKGFADDATRGTHDPAPART